MPISIGTCVRFYTQMLYIQALVRRCGWKKNKAFAYRIYSHFTQQCEHSVILYLITNLVKVKVIDKSWKTKKDVTVSMHKVFVYFGLSRQIKYVIVYCRLKLSFPEQINIKQPVEFLLPLKCVWLALCQQIPRYTSEITITECINLLSIS